MSICSGILERSTGGALLAQTTKRPDTAIGGGKSSNRTGADVRENWQQNTKEVVRKSFVGSWTEKNSDRRWNLMREENSYQHKSDLSSKNKAS
jgi:hypothetical protein